MRRSLGGSALGADLQTQAVPASFNYDGDSVAFIKADGSAFGMWAAQDGTTVEYKDGKVVVNYVPKNKTVYAGFYLNADISDSTTWSTDSGKWFAVSEDGSLSFEIDAGYAGKALPVAPVKKSDSTATTSDQYYLAIPAAEYSGDDVSFVDQSGKAFGMFAAQDGTSAIYKDGKIVINYVPKTTTTYSGFYKNASIADSATWTSDNWFALTDGALSIELDASYAGKCWPVAPVKASDNTATTSSQYYLAIPFLDKIDAQYEFSPMNTEKMFVVVKAIIEDSAEGQDYLTFYLSGKSYGWAFSGTQDDAVASWDSKDSDSRWAQASAETISYDYITWNNQSKSGTDEEKLGYRIPITVPEGETTFDIPVVAYATDFTARNFAVDLTAMTITPASASDVAALTVSSSVADVAASAAGTLDYTGYARPYAGGMTADTQPPLSNDFVGTLSINLGSDSVYDQAYAVTYQGQPWLDLSTATVNDPAESDYATVGSDGALALNIVNEYDTTPKTAQLNGNIITVMMHVADSADYVEAGTWVERTFQLDFTSRTAATLAISGEALTTKAAAAAAAAAQADLEAAQAAAQAAEEKAAAAQAAAAQAEEAAAKAAETGSAEDIAAAEAAAAEATAAAAEATAAAEKAQASAAATGDEAAIAAASEAAATASATTVSATAATTTAAAAEAATASAKTAAETKAAEEAAAAEAKAAEEAAAAKAAEEAAAAKAAEEAAAKAAEEAAAAEKAAAEKEAAEKAEAEAKAAEEAAAAAKAAEEAAAAAKAAEEAAAAEKASSATTLSAQKITGKAKKTKSYKANKKGKLAKKRTVNVKKLFNLKAKTSMTFAKANKKGGKKIVVAKSGKVALKKGLKAGTYKVKIKVTAKKTAKYKKATKTIVLTVKVKK